jgi:predicted AAA+ superfamily ATPase
LEYYDIKGKKILKTSPKFYSSDLGLLNSQVGYTHNNYGFKLENIIFIELLRRYDNVYTYSGYNGVDIDFICLKDGVITYFQVAKTINNNRTYNREIDSLEKLRNSNEKILLVHDNISEVTESGIKIINIQK